MVQQGFFSGSASKSQRIANAGASTPVRIDTVTTGEGKKFQRVLPNFGAGRVGEIRLKKAEAEQKENKPFFSQRLAQNKVAQPLSEPGSEAFNKEIKQYEESIRKDLDFDMIDRYGTDELKNLTEEGKQRLEDSYKIYRQYNYDRNPLQYQQGVDFSEKKDEGNILTKTGNFIANIFTPPAVAGTLEGKPTRFAGEADPTPRPKLDYVNPDKTTMTGSEIRDAFRPSNLFGYKDKFGRYGEAVDRDRQQTMNQVSERYSSMPDPDARSLSQIRQDRAAKMKTDAEQRQARFKETGVQTFGGKVQPQKSADVTYGTNMLSNPAFGFRSKMKPEDQKKYDKSARDATEAAKPDPSIGNVIAQTINRVSGLVGGPQMSLESIGERQLRLANKEVNRPSYQKEAYARNQLGITIGDIRARQRTIIEQNARARNQVFQANKRAAAVERAARRYGSNTGTGRDGGFGTGTVGKGMPSNPGSMRQTGVGVSANNLSRHSTGHSSGRKGSTGSKGSKGSSGGTGGGTSKGSTTGRTASKASKSRTGRARSQCDIRTKIDIAPLTNPDLIRDDLANIAYFVKEIK